MSYTYYVSIIISIVHISAAIDNRQYNNISASEDGCILGCCAVQSVEVYIRFRGACYLHQGDDGSLSPNTLLHVQSVIT
jgi:hypothetical protein